MEFPGFQVFKSILLNLSWLFGAMWFIANPIWILLVVIFEPIRFFAILTFCTNVFLTGVSKSIGFFGSIWPCSKLIWALQAIVGWIFCVCSNEMDWLILCPGMVSFEPALDFSNHSYRDLWPYWTFLSAEALLSFELTNCTCWCFLSQLNLCVSRSEWTFWADVFLLKPILRFLSRSCWVFRLFTKLWFDSNPLPQFSESIGLFGRMGVSSNLLGDLQVVGINVFRTNWAFCAFRDDVYFLVQCV